MMTLCTFKKWLATVPTTTAWSLTELGELIGRQQLFTRQSPQKLRALLKQLHPDAAAAFDQGKITRTCAKELTHVKPERQKEILSAMEGYKDYSVAFARALVLKTPPEQRESRSRKKEPWGKNGQRKSDLLKKLAEAEQKHDFYSRLYKQYTIDLLRLAVYARSLITNIRIRTYLDEHHAVIVERFENVIADAKE